ncbi:AraC family transcriptional regulator [Nocardia neocaledoniensis]|uniref:AraC family transcriptional regulator n=1 Tax=Nocardia neocaledoniensis TaxID=236511 RepID=UPI00245544CA|nr:AraC family transcriptional regulator [Nocardia neocaledoniensis]
MDRDTATVAGGCGGTLSETCGSPLVWIRPGHAGYLGLELGVDPHSTSVAVLSVGLNGPFVLETATHGEILARSALAPARAVHRVNSRDDPILLLFVDIAESSAGAIAAEMTSTVGPFGLGHRRERELIELCTGPDVDPDRLFGLLAGGRARPIDPRIAAVAAAIRRHPHHPFRAEAVAARLDLSTSHFLRLFAQQCGTTFRRYQQWARMIHALRGIADGHDFTRCAVDAGFATPSHFSETVRRMFGAPLSRLLRHDVRFDLGPPAGSPRPAPLERLASGC